MKPDRLICDGRKNYGYLRLFVPLCNREAVKLILAYALLVSSRIRHVSTLTIRAAGNCTAKAAVTPAKKISFGTESISGLSLMAPKPAL